MGVRAGIVAPGVASGQGGIGVLAAAPGSFSGCSCFSIEAAFFSPIFLFLFFFRGKKAFRLLRVVVALCHALGAGMHLGTKCVLLVPACRNLPAVSTPSNPARN